eukprot:TRINITY_DN1357_c0_g1_i1.p2 TRINITY_DN1357_c0_g1~~TRINITY_DN1357_c0_g1_i1.p2  ORF type:complete len:116 (-),score=31.42 TRINITY_DN1357_c0_g1_i1:162-509(-)
MPWFNWTNDDSNNNNANNNNTIHDNLNANTNTQTIQTQPQLNTTPPTTTSIESPQPISLDLPQRTITDYVRDKITNPLNLPIVMVGVPIYNGYKFTSELISRSYDEARAWIKENL